MTMQIYLMSPLLISYMKEVYTLVGKELLDVCVNDDEECTYMITGLLANNWALMLLLTHCDAKSSIPLR